MRHGRAKQTRRTLQFFERSAGIRPPYNVLVDGTFLIASLKFKIPLEDRLSKILQQSPFRLYFLSGTLRELHSIKSQTKDGEVFDQAIQYLRDHGTKLEETSTGESASHEDLSGAAADIYNFVAASNNPKNDSPSYIVASQDEDLLSLLRNSVMVPILRLTNNTVLLLERASKQMQRRTERLERDEKPIFDRQPETAQSVDHGRAKKGKAKAPNPLSCKKKKKRAVGEQQHPSQEEKAKKRRRRRKGQAAEEKANESE